MLQAERYATEVVANDPQNSQASVARRVEFRKRRQARLRDPAPPTITAVLSETALHQVVGTKDALIEQLDYLVDLSHELVGSLEIRILPFSSPPRGLVSASTLVLLSFDPHELLPTAAFVESMSHHQMSYEVNSALGLCFAQALEASLDRERSLELIQEQAERLRASSD